MKKFIFILAAFLAALSVTTATHAAVSVTNVKVQQRYPWNGLVDIDYTVTADDPDADVFVYVSIKDKDLNRAIAPRTLTGASASGAPIKPGTHRLTWNMKADEPKLNSSALTATVHAYTAKPYMVITLTGGTTAANYPVRYESAPPAITDNIWRGDELWLKFIPPGTFMMGSPTDEAGRTTTAGVEPLHQVTLTKPYYIGVFEVTQRQWELVMGTKPATYKGDARPVESVSYDTIRGTANGGAWPINGQVDASSFLGKLRAKASVAFDLPTEAQWEMACRADTSTALNSGKTATDANLTVLGRYSSNQSDSKGLYNGQHNSVGAYLPNAWGLYDMHGNVYEWCLDRYGDLSSAAATDPVGTGVLANTSRVVRGGYWDGAVAGCRSAARYLSSPSNSSYGSGLRLVALPAVR